MYNYSSYINGEFIKKGIKTARISPATMKRIGTYIRAGSLDVKQAIDSAEKAFPGWRDTDIKIRQKYFLNAASVLYEKREEIARLIALENGKPISEALTIEIIPVIDSLYYYGNNAIKLLKSKSIKYRFPLFAHKHGETHFAPLGVIGIISPWNYPFLIPFLEILAALITGNTIVLKPASLTTMIGASIAEIFDKVSLPPGVLNIVLSGARESSAILSSTKIKKIAFTGSVPVGKMVMREAAKNLKPVLLELGGKDPFIVLDDANIERAAAGAVWGAFTNSGQVCASVERVYIHKNIAQSFIERVIRKTSDLIIGDPLDLSTDIGALTDSKQIEVIESQIKDAVKKGAIIMTGGKRVKGKGNFFEPTVLINVNHSMKIMKEETFGPVLPIMEFSSIDEAIQLANDSQFGLASSVWTRSSYVGSKIAEQLETGTVLINDVIFSFGEATVTWGGVKESGIGRSHSVYGLKEFVNIKHVSIDLLDKNNALWWYPYDPPFFRMIDNAIRSMYGRNFFEHINGFFSLIKDIGRIIRRSSLITFFKRMWFFLTNK